MALQGLQVLSHLQRIGSPPQNESHTAVLICLASFSDDTDAWNCSSVREQASILANDYIESTNLPALLSGILEKRIKSIFSGSTNPALTPQGRKAIASIQGNVTTAHIDIDAGVKLWKYRDVYIVSVFQWVLQHLDVRVTKILIFCN